MPNRGGRPRVRVYRKLEDFPPPTPLESPCRIWQGAVDGDGYGILTGSGNLVKERIRAHRWVYAFGSGLRGAWEIPAGVVIRHRCDNRPCFRFSHLEPGTVADNNRDARERGHIGRVLQLRPSEVKLLFELREAGWTYRRIWETHFSHLLSFSAITRIGRMGREGFDADWNRVFVPDPVSKYAAWRGEQPELEPWYGLQLPDEGDV